MEGDRFERSVRFAGYLIAGSILIAFGIEFTVTSLIGVISDCVVSSSPNGFCSGPEVWQLLAPLIAGAILIIIAIVFFLLARANSTSVVRQAVNTDIWSPPPPPPPA